MKPDPRSARVSAIQLGGLALLPLSTDFYLASLPAIARHFGALPGSAQLTLSVFLLGFAFSQMFAGPLSDRFGRRPVLISGFAIYATASLACLAASSLGFLIGARFMQALGAGCGVVLARSIVRDIHGAQGAARQMALLTTFMALAPTLGPVIGGFLEASLGWRANFAALLAIGILLVASTWLWFGESNLQKNAAATRMATLAGNYGTLIRHREFIGYTAVFTLCYCGIFAWISGSSFVLIGLFGIAPQVYGMLFGLSAMGYAVGAFVAARLARRLNARQMLRIGVHIALAGGTLALACAWLLPRSPAALVAPMWVFLFSTGFVMPAGMAGAVAPFPLFTGTAASLMGVSQMLGGAATSAIVTRLLAGTSLPMAAAVCLLTCAMLAVERTVLAPACGNPGAPGPSAGKPRSRSDPAQAGG